MDRRTERQMLDLITGVALDDPRIHAVYMNGSRANPNVEPDVFQDFDIVYVVTETESFITDRSWQEPKRDDPSSSYCWLMLFSDGNRIDLQIKTISAALPEYQSDTLTVLLLDKDGALPDIAPASDAGYYTKKPGAEEFALCCNDFWWCLNNVAKGIVRSQLSYVMWMFNTPVRDELVKMLSWHIAEQRNFQVNAAWPGSILKNTLRRIYMRVTQRHIRQRQQPYMGRCVHSLRAFPRGSVRGCAEAWLCV